MTDPPKSSDRSEETGTALTSTPPDIPLAVHFGTAINENVHQNVIENIFRLVAKEALSKEEYQREIIASNQLEDFIDPRVQQNSGLVRRIGQTLYDRGLNTQSHEKLEQELLGKLIIRTLWHGDIA